MSLSQCWTGVWEQRTTDRYAHFFGFTLSTTVVRAGLLFRAFIKMIDEEEYNMLHHVVEECTKLLLI
jgi:hypothetical protein